MGRVLGGRNGPNIEIWNIFGSVLFEAFFGVKFGVIFENIDDEKHIDLLSFVVIFLAFVLTFETLKIVLPSRRNAYFYKIAFFARDEKGHQK